MQLTLVHLSLTFCRFEVVEKVVPALCLSNTIECMVVSGLEMVALDLFCRKIAALGHSWIGKGWERVCNTQLY